MTRNIRILAAVSIVAGIATTVYLVFHGSFGTYGVPATVYSFEELTGSLFLPVVKEPFRPPRVRELPLPAFDNAMSIWGAIGRDFRGRIWAGVSAASHGKSAHLFEFDPDADNWRDHGSVVEQLKAARLYREGEGQIKIHSRIIPGSDGWLYFASTDEEGERDDGTAPPKWGSHLWRIHPERDKWQHLLAVPEGLIAVSGVGRYIYALGYWGHVLYQFDSVSGKSERVVVGSVGGHISRNLLADVHGHAYVPRLKMQGDGKVSVALVEFDANLKEIKTTPLEFYLGNEPPQSNHGIIGFAYFPDGHIVFATHRGHLYGIDPRDVSGAIVMAIGWLHPDGEAYTPSLFSFGGTNWIAGVARRQDDYEWVVTDLSARISAAFPLDTKSLQKVLLYGSMSRDNQGRVYVGGWAEKVTSNMRPLVLQIDPGR